jgi:hypothetical protein
VIFCKKLVSSTIGQQSFCDSPYVINSFKSNTRIVIGSVLSECGGLLLNCKQAESYLSVKPHRESGLNKNNSIYGKEKVIIKQA